MLGLRKFYSKYESYFSPIVLFGGFLFDNLTLRRIDLWIENLVMIIYLAIALVAIFFINIWDVGFFSKFLPKKGKIYLSFVLQFVFGGLFSAFFIFYSRSASIFDSWLFVLILLGLLVGNEKFQKYYLRFTFQIIIFFIALFSYLVFAVPIWLGKMGDAIFLFSGSLSLLTIWLIVFIFYKIMPAKYEKTNKSVFLGIISVYFCFNLFYFSNIIPPIPLSLKEKGVYHMIEKIGGDYIVSSEKYDWYDISAKTNPEIHWEKGEPIYFYSAIFAPTKINTDIYHCWMFFDEDKGGWIIKDKLGFKIIGGRDGGYRGYSFKHNLEPGNWKVEVINDQEQVLGRGSFRIVEAQGEVELESEVK